MAKWQLRGVRSGRALGGALLLQGLRVFFDSRVRASTQLQFSMCMGLRSFRKRAVRRPVCCGAATCVSEVWTVWGVGRIEAWPSLPWVSPGQEGGV